MRTAPPGSLAATRVLLAERGSIVDEWAELCRWDPSLPPDSQPVDGADLLVAVASALTRPQPIGWGVDPDVEDAVRRFASRPASVGEAVGQLACLREALARRLRGRLPDDEIEETSTRLGVILDRAIGCAAQVLADRLEADALADSLTGLGNRRAFDRDLRRELGRAARHDRRFSVALLDLDGLKAINDRDGHAAGDAALRHTAGAIRSALRAGDGAFRFGGEEFVVILPGASAAEGLRVAERIRLKLEQTPVHYAGQSIAFTASIGVAAGAPLAFSAADSALYDAKREGRNRVREARAVVC